MENSKRQTVSLVLGSGGARGLAHIGVINWLLENNYEIKSISGCSIGSLIGGVYAAGKLKKLEQWMCALTKADILSLLDLSWDRSGFVKGDKIINTLVELIGDISIEDLPISFTAVAADIKGEKEVWINSGRLFDAIRASISLPLFFTPYDFNGIMLIDGGVLNPVPIAPTFSDETDLTIAVNLGGPVSGGDPKESKSPEGKNQALPLKININQFIEKYQISIGKTGKRSWSMYDIADQAFDAMQGAIARQKIAAYPPDAVIEIARDACGTLAFDRAAEMIELGYRKAGESLIKEA